MLPADLRSAEAEAIGAIQAALRSSPRGLWSVELRFEGLRIQPLALRLLGALRAFQPDARLLCADAGSTALAQRDAPELAEAIASLKDQQRLQQAEGGSEELLLMVAPGPSDYDLVERVCAMHRASVVLLNANLEDAAVGIGSVARERRKGFLLGLQTAYALIPTADGALRRAFPEPWQLYRSDPDGYRAVASFERKPDLEEQALALAHEQGLSINANLRLVDAFIDGLSR